MSPAIPPTPRHRPRRFGVYAPQLSPDLGRIPLLAARGASATAGVGQTSTGRFPQLPPLPRPPWLRPRRGTAPLQRSADVLQISDSRWRRGPFADQKPRAAQDGEASPEIPHARTDDGTAGRADQSVAVTPEQIRRPAGFRERVLARRGNLGNDLLVRPAGERIVRTCGGRH